TPSPPPLPPSPPTPPPTKQKFEDEKSQFLNSFDLTPIKTEQSSSPIKSTGTPPSPVESTSSSKKSPTSSAAPTTGTVTTTTTTTTPVNGSSTQTKRKAKDSAGGATRSGSKKPKLSDDEMKAIVEKTVAENIRSPSEHIVPPIFLKPKVPPVASPSSVSSSRQQSPPLQSSSAKSESKTTTKTTTTTTPPPKRDSPRPFVFKTPPPPPPIVSSSNIPAVKPSQQVLPAPIAQKPSLPPIRPSSAPKASGPAAKTSSPLAPQAPIRKPTTPTKLPTSSTLSGGAANAAPQPLANGTGTSVAPTNSTTHSVATGSSKQQKPLELKRAQSNPSINIPPPVAAPQTSGMPRDTEISKLRPEDLKKNVKVYGPPTATEKSTNPARPADSTNFAVPNKVAAPKTTSSLTVTSTTKASATSSATGPQVQGAKARPVNYLNYALLNSKAAAAGSRTPIPSYSSNSPSYSPDSPQYNPNLNFSPKQFKYANPLAYSSHLQNMLTERKSGSTSPPSSTITIPASSPSPPQAKEQTAAAPSSSISVTPASNKRPASALSPDAEEKKLQPPEKQATLPNPPNPLDKFPSGIPDGLSVTLATDEDDAARIKNVNKQLKNNFIEIRPLPDVPVTEVKLPLPHPNTIPKQQDRRTPPSKVGSSAAGSMAGPSSSVSQVVRKSTPPTNPTYSMANSILGKTSVSSAPSNGTVDAIQRKIYDIIEKRITPDGAKTANSKSSQQKPPTMPPISRPSTPKVPAYPVSNNRFKQPNATVNENGTLKLHNYRELDLIPKGVNFGAGSTTSKSSASSSSSAVSSSSSRMMPPPTT
uniref:Uncharacterized protein n=1 Tax=Anopheles maculatus TaxID=74869 RepID=A0A182SLP1_9DIPT